MQHKKRPIDKTIVLNQSIQPVPKKRKSSSSSTIVSYREKQQSKKERQQSKKERKKQKVIGNYPLLGEGSYGQVYALKGKRALKILCDVCDPLHLSKLGLSRATIMECYVNSCFENIVSAESIDVHYLSGYCQHLDKCYCSCDCQIQTHIVMLKCDGDVTSIPVKYQEFHFYLKIFYDVLRGLHSLHSQNIIHGDLCLRNILVKNNLAVLGDFSNARWVATPYHEQIHQRRYAPPEALWAGESYTSSEIWVFASLFLETMLKILGAKFRGNLFQSDFIVRYLPKINKLTHDCDDRNQIALLACIFGYSSWAVEPPESNTEIQVLYDDMKQEWKPEHTIGLSRYVQDRIGEKTWMEIKDKIQPVLEFANFCMSLNPEERPTTDDLLQHVLFEQYFDLNHLELATSNLIYYPSTNGILDIEKIQEFWEDIVFAYLALDMFDRIRVEDRGPLTLICCARIINIVVCNRPNWKTTETERPLMGLQCKMGCLATTHTLEEIRILNLLKWRIFGDYQEDISSGDFSQENIMRLQEVRKEKATRKENL